MNLNLIFEPGKPRDMTGWYFFEAAFSRDEIAKIKEEIEKVNFTRAGIASHATGEALNVIRKSNIKWLPKNESFAWVYDRLMNYITIANENMWGFDLYSVLDSIQYTQYDGTEQGFYDWHLDTGPDELSYRKVSLVVQLSDPIAYEGGDLEIRSGGGLSKASKTIGTVTIFPSYLLHRVTPVTSGLRESLVLWAGGEHYR